MTPDGKYKLTTKPPKAPKAPYQAPSGQGEAVAILRDISTTLKAIHALLNSKITLANDPLEKIADEESAPF
jgi:hypothetical protein